MAKAKKKKQKSPADRAREEANAAEEALEAGEQTDAADDVITGDGEPAPQGELSPLEEAALSTDAKETQQAAGEVVDASFDSQPAAEEEDDDEDEPAEKKAYFDKSGQAALYPNDARISGKQVDITEAYKSVQSRLKKYAEHASFFKQSSAYIATLDPGPEGDVVKMNLLTALSHCGDLEKDLRHAIAQLEKVDELEEDLNALMTSAALYKKKEEQRQPDYTYRVRPDEASAIEKLSGEPQEGEIIGDQIQGRTGGPVRAVRDFIEGAGHEVDEEKIAEAQAIVDEPVEEDVDDDAEKFSDHVDDIERAETLAGE